MVQTPFVWRELMSTDPQAARKFYTELFGWTTIEQEMGEIGVYTMWSNNDHRFGGLVPLDPKEGLSSHWMTYISTPGRLEETLQKIEQLGGCVHVPPTEIPKTGRFAVVSDPDGAFFSPFEGLPEDPEKAASPPASRALGDFCWTELLAKNAEAESRFYAEVFGWSVGSHDMGPPTGLYYLLLHEGKDFAGILNMPPDATGKPCWLPYILVDDVDESAGRAEKLGAVLCAPPRDIPGIGRFSVIQDPTGALLALYKDAHKASA